MEFEVAHDEFTGTTREWRTFNTAFIVAIEPSKPIDGEARTVLVFQDRRVHLAAEYAYVQHAVRSAP